jgi:hypothetical protein
VERLSDYGIPGAAHATMLNGVRARRHGRLLAARDYFEAATDLWSPYPKGLLDASLQLGEVSLELAIGQADKHRALVNMRLAQRIATTLDIPLRRRAQNGVELAAARMHLEDDQAVIMDIDQELENSSHGDVLRGWDFFLPVQSSPDEI